MSRFDSPHQHYYATGWEAGYEEFVRVRGRLLFWRHYLVCVFCGHRERVR